VLAPKKRHLNKEISPDIIGPIMLNWHTEHASNGFPIERVTLGAFSLSVAYIAGEWQWLVQCEGIDVAEGAARAARAARQQAEAVALRLTGGSLPKAA
jgi:hypothetical protein